MTDPDTIRAQHREGWEQAAPGWETGTSFYTATEVVNDWLIEHVAPAPGQRILEVAAGRGDLSRALAPRVLPGGEIVCTDGAEAMVEVAKRFVEDDNVTHRTMELEWVDADAASFDAIVSRFGYMLCVDPEAALREARRVLRHGGRLALAVWDLAADNPWLAAVGEEAVKAGLFPTPEVGTPGPFALAAPGALEEVLGAAGFVAPTIESVDLTFEAPSLDAVWDEISERATFLRALSPADHYRLRDAVDQRWGAYAAADGSLAIPGRVRCALAEA